VNYHFDRGYLSIDDKPGIGVEFDEDEATKFPYSMACLPVARLGDGTPALLVRSERCVSTLQLPGDIDVYSLLISTVAPRPSWLVKHAFFGQCSQSGAVQLLLVSSRINRQSFTLVSGAETVNSRIRLATCSKPKRRSFTLRTRKLAEAMVSTGSDVGPNVDEFSIAGLASVKSDVVRPERLRDGAIAYECRVYRHIEVGTGPTDLFLLEALVAHIQDGLLGRQ